ncbi:MAG: ribonuclease HI [Ginsengibacter sp.]
MADNVIIYTDGSSRGNPGRGGYGTILLYGSHQKELSKGFRLTTNNRMELMAVIAGLEALKKPNLHLLIYSDSNYVVKAVMEGWLSKWLKTNFKGNIKNRDLWEKYHLLSQEHHIQFTWVKGHGANVLNNRCDELATKAADGQQLFADQGYELLKS